ncbi:MAG: hypothetical protein KIT83_15360 [Bryobacterales bacterium]|nr:hypothetical protein [Bryobacterales bacterium]
MQSSTAKKVIVHRYEREPVLGYVHPSSYLQPDFVEILLANGVLQRIPYLDIKQISFVKDFDSSKGQSEQRIFQSRPKLEGLWVRLDFRDGDFQEGVLANNLALSEATGFTVTPPNATGNTQRIFVPRTALSALTVLAVMGLKASKKPREKGSSGQQSLFGDEQPPAT